ncbi:MAG TPA: carbohydrate porin [Steroidobacteraceae bacterium]|nr:carbohydrate porin [Steroidobacteraceae bacterium]
MAAGISANDAAPVTDENFAIHGQVTYTEQEDDGFHAPYSGPQSLSADIGRETVDATLFVGVRLWSQGEFWVNPEIDQGFGLDNTLGVAGFPSAEAYKVGRKQPYLRFPRIFVRQTIDTGTERESVAPDANQLAGSRSPDRWVFTAGKFAVTDIFDTNQYAHDPRSDFLNWVAVDAGTFDYAADAWGYTVGAAIERYAGTWTLRAGAFDLSNVPNSPRLESGFDEFQLLAEIEKRYALFGQTGRILMTGYQTRGRMGLLDQAIALSEATDTLPDIAAVRSYRSRFGASLNLEQPITQNLGVFARVGKATGNVEPYEFTDVDRSVELGASLKGMAWHRAEDTVGFAALDDGISAARQQYLNLGGLGILVGDGKLPHPAAEQILETYYSARICSAAQVSLDYQWVKNPAYNTERGPVSLVAVRVHVQF